jgi:hypothetical protein
MSLLLRCAVCFIVARKSLQDLATESLAGWSSDSCCNEVMPIRSPGKFKSAV